MALAIAITIACLCLPLGYFEPKGMGLNAEMFNLWIKQPEGGVSMTSSVLFAIQVLTASIGVWAIVGFRNRPRQAKLCVVNMLLLIVWYRDYTFHADLAICFPLIAIILYWMARRGVLADEKLVRAADRIR